MDTRRKKRGWPKATWRRPVEAEVSIKQHKRGTTQSLVASRERRGEPVDALQDVLGGNCLADRRPWNLFSVYDTKTTMSDILELYASPYCPVKTKTN